jgi:methionyl-tRNA synthetase
MICRYRDGEVPAGPTDVELGREFADLAERVAHFMDRAEPTQALELIWQRVRRLNRYVEERAPWQLAKDASQAEALDMTLRSLFEGIRVVTLLLYPYMPRTTARLLDALGVEDLDYRRACWAERTGAMADALEPLFPRPVVA